MKFKFFNSGTEVRPSSDPQGSQGQDGNSSGRTDSVRSAFGSILTISSKISTNSEEVRRVDLFVYKKSQSNVQKIDFISKLTNCTCGVGWTHSHIVLIKIQKTSRV